MADPIEKREALSKQKSSNPKELPTMTPETESGKVRKRAAAIQAFSVVIQ